MTMTVRMLNDTGLERFREYVGRLAGGAKDQPPPAELLTSPASSDALPVDVRVDPSLTFTSKLDFGKYLHEQLTAVLALAGSDKNIGLWSWLDLCFFDHTCPERPDGTRRPGADHRHILSNDYKHHYRHLVRTPCLVYGIHGEHAVVVLRGEIHVHGEASEQILSREQIFTNKALFKAMHNLYVMVDGSGAVKLKSGARGDGGGSMRRLGKILRQFDLTYDLRMMSRLAILDLLPGEFARFKSRTAPRSGAQAGAGATA